MEFGNEHDTTRQTDFGTPTNHALAKYDVIVYLVEVGGAKNRSCCRIRDILMYRSVYTCRNPTDVSVLQCPGVLKTV